MADLGPRCYNPFCVKDARLGKSNFSDLLRSLSPKVTYRQYIEKNHKNDKIDQMHFC